MPKKIVIIGGGISGLSLLHFLVQKYSSVPRVEILLLEKNGHLGGTIRTLSRGGCLFETGPNGFLDSQPRTLALVKDIGLEDQLVRAGEQSKIRYLSVNNALHPLPVNPKSFLTFSLLNPLEKARVLGEFFVPKGNDPGESVYAFGKRRFGEKFSQVFLDPMVSGIYAGDARKANLRKVFPRIHALESEHGSLFKAMINLRKAKPRGRVSKNGPMGAPTGTLTSFRGGMGRLIETLGTRNREYIRLNQEITTITFKDKQFRIYPAKGNELIADELYLCTPAYGAGPMMRACDPALARALEKIFYAPVAVLGLVCPAGKFPNIPEGFGYLIPSSEQKEILGVLFEHNVFPDRCPRGKVMFRVMIGGARYPDILEKTEEELFRLVQEEFITIAGNQPVKLDKSEADEIFFMPWKRAIPQYDGVYCEAVKDIEDRLAKTPRLHLVANYLKGVSLNDCIENAFQAAQLSSAG